VCVLFATFVVMVVVLMKREVDLIKRLRQIDHWKTMVYCRDGECIEISKKRIEYKGNNLERTDAIIVDDVL